MKKPATTSKVRDADSLAEAIKIANEIVSLEKRLTAILGAAPSGQAIRQARAAKALEGHPHAQRILGMFKFRDPTPRELEISASLKGRARAALARHGREAA